VGYAAGGGAESANMSSSGSVSVPRKISRLDERLTPWLNGPQLNGSRFHIRKFWDCKESSGGGG